MKLTVKYFESLDLALRLRNVSFAPKTVLRLLEHIKEIESEKAVLLQQIEQDAEAQKPVVIPVEVANAIEFLLVSGISEYGMIALSDQIPMLGKDYSKEILEELEVVRKFANFDSNFKNSGPDTLLEALANGYTTETVESKIESAVQEVHQSWKRLPFCDEQSADEYLVKMISERVSDIIREDQAGQ